MMKNVYVAVAMYVAFTYKKHFKTLSTFVLVCDGACEKGLIDTYVINILVNLVLYCVTICMSLLKMFI